MIYNLYYSYLNLIIGSSNVLLQLIRILNIHYYYLLLINHLNIYLSDFNLPFKIDVNLIDKFYMKDLTYDIYEKNLIKNRKIDSLLGGCNIGPHKSDYLFNFNNDYLVSQLSTGQQKTVILLIYLAHCKYLLIL